MAGPPEIPEAPPALTRRDAGKIKLPDFDVEGPSPIYDLKEMPLWLAVLQWGELKNRNWLINGEIEDAINAVNSKIAESLDIFNAGYLLRVNIYTDPEGNPFIPGGEILTPIGLGTEPTDALAEFYRMPRVEQVDPPRALTNSSFFFWITDQGAGKLDARLIPNQMLEPLEESGRREGRRRELLASLYSAMPADGLESIQRADYWSDVYRRYSASIKDDAARAAIARIDQEMAALQADTNRLFEEHQRAIANMIAAQQSQATLTAISTVLGLVREGIRSGAICSTADRPASPDGNATSSTDDLMEIQRTREMDMNGVKVRTSIDIQGPVDKLRGLEDQLFTGWRDAGVPINRPPPIPMIAR